VRISIDKSNHLANDDYDVIPLELLNSLIMLGLPNHKITLKIGAPIMLLRNLVSS